MYQQSETDYNSKIQEIANALVNDVRTDAYEQMYSYVVEHNDDIDCAEALVQELTDEVILKIKEDL